MFWVAVSAGGLVGLVLLAALAGSLLPRAHSASVRARLAKPPGEIWSTIRSPAR